MQTNHPDLERVHLLKIDVETKEIEVLNGAMFTLCNLVVERIIVEVEYLKPFYNSEPIRCNFDKLQQTLVQMGYDIYDAEEQSTLMDKKLPEFPPDIVFKLKDMAQSPANRLRGSVGDPCEKFYERI